MLHQDPHVLDAAQVDAWQRLDEAVMTARESVRAQTDRLDTEKRVLEEHVDSLTAKLTTALSDAECSRAEASAAREEVMRLKCELSEERERAEKLARRVKRRDVQLSEVAQQVSAAAQRQKLAEEENQELKEEAASHEAALATMAASLREKQMALQAAQGERRALDEALATSRADSERRAAANEGLRQKVAERDKRLAEITRCAHESPLADLSNSPSLATGPPTYASSAAPLCPPNGASTVVLFVGATGLNPRPAVRAPLLPYSLQLARVHSSSRCALVRTGPTRA